MRIVTEDYMYGGMKANIISIKIIEDLHGGEKSVDPYSLSNINLP